MEGHLARWRGDRPCEDIADTLESMVLIRVTISVVFIIVVALASILQRISRRRKFDRHGRVDSRAVAAASSGVGGLLQLRGVHGFRHRSGRHDRQRRRAPRRLQQRGDLRRARRSGGVGHHHVVARAADQFVSCARRCHGGSCGRRGRVERADRQWVPDDRGLHRPVASGWITAGVHVHGHRSTGSSIDDNAWIGSTKGSVWVSCSRRPRSAWRMEPTMRRRRWASSWPC